ncbi:hypothetical protein INT45_007590 [Circinella minor]|uniref:Uncharacterized protein n=1 Tax=Circinella minor TaxID=1195481 RepID=A0A8H7RYC7_9FUNG|nr:hypothetical protein INT45_007590 [Circinella minor]
MHPVLIVLIVASVPLGAWAAYEGAEYIREWWSERQDRKQYEEFVRQHYNNNEKQRPLYKRRSFDEDDDDDDEPLVKSIMARRSSSNCSELRHRYQQQYDKFQDDDYELFEMNQSIIARRQQLAREQAMLDQQEIDLQRRRESIQSRGNSLMGMPSPSTSTFVQPPTQQQYQQQQLRSSISSLESGHTARNNNEWIFTRPPQSIIDSPSRVMPRTEDLGPKLGVIEAAEWDAIHHHSNSDSDEDDHHNNNSNKTMQMPEPQQSQYQHQEHSRQVSESEGSWADLHVRMQSRSSDVMSYNSMRTPSSPPHSYGVRSISSDDNDTVATRF